MKQIIFSLAFIFLFILSSCNKKATEEVLTQEDYNKLEAQVIEEADLYLIEKAAIYIPSDSLILFAEKVRGVAKDLSVPAEWLMAVMYSESRFNAAVENFRGTGQVGLIQFGPTWAKAHETTTEQLAKMNHVTQMDYVFKYFEWFTPIHGYENLTDFYVAIIQPDAIGKYDYVIFSKELNLEKYKQNIGLDENKDGVIDWGDIDRRMQRVFPKAYAIKMI